MNFLPFFPTKLEVRYSSLTLGRIMEAEMKVMEAHTHTHTHTRTHTQVIEGRMPSCKEDTLIGINFEEARSMKREEHNMWTTIT